MKSGLILILKIFAVILVIAVVAAVGFGLFYTQRYTHPPYRQAFINGHILTMDAKNTVAEAVVIERDRILAVGSYADVEKYIDGSTKVIDLQGKTMMPGIIDAHSHFPGSSLSLVAVDVNSPPIGLVMNMGDVLARLREKAARTPKGQWILAFGFDDTQISEKRYPTLAELDAISTEHPIFVMHISGHTGVANSPAFQAVGFDSASPDPVGGKIEHDPATGALTGLVTESAAEKFRSAATNFSIIKGIGLVEAAGKQYTSMGVTTAQNGYLTANYRKSLVPLAQVNFLPVRLVVLPDEETADKILAGELKAEDTPRLHWGAFKLILDGSIQAYTAYLEKPYYVPPGDGYRGYLAMDEQAFRDAVMRYQAAGRQIAVHTNGDAAMDVFIDAFAAAQAVYPSADPRAVFIHAQTLRYDQLDRAGKLGMTPSFFSAHVYYWGDRHRDIFLGPERAAQISPAQTALQKGVRFTMHLDTPVVPQDPWLLMWSAVNRQTASGAELGLHERIDVMTALRAVTIDAAWQTFMEDELGSVETGKYADLIILSSNPLLDPANLRNIQVEQTIVGGVTVFER